MSQVQLSYRSVEASITSLKVQSSRQDIAARIGQPTRIDPEFNAQQRQIIDDVGISQDALLKLKEAQDLANQLQSYLDYLNGKTGAISIELVPNEGDSNIEIAGRSTNLAASITVASYKETNIDVAANFDDDGNLTSLSVSKTEIEAQYIQTSTSFEQTQFYARI